MVELAINTLQEKRLYRFRSLDRQRPEHSSRIFTHSELYCASPSQLNDPWETSPNVVMGDLNDPTTKQKFVNQGLRAMMHGKQESEAEQIRDWLEKYTQEDVDRFAEQFRESIHKAFRDRYRICSFSDNLTHPLLWSHYSASHKGFCLEFDASTPDFGNAMKVSYQHDYPTIDPMSSTDDGKNEKEMELCCLTKAHFWAYEREYRVMLIAPSETGSPVPEVPGIHTIDDHIFRFRPDLLTSVIFGCQMSQADKDLIMEWCGDRVPPIQFRRMVKSATSFELEVVPA